jgi:hypothetical protein
MPTVGVSLAANAISTVVIPPGAGRIVCTLVTNYAGSSASPTLPVAITTDGTTPVGIPSTPPAQSTPTGNIQYLPGIGGAYVVFAPIYLGGQPAGSYLYPSGATPTIAPGGTIVQLLTTASQYDVSVSW